MEDQVLYARMIPVIRDPHTKKLYPHSFTVRDEHNISRRWTSADRRWKIVTSAYGAILRKIRLQQNRPGSPLVFEVHTKEEVDDISRQEQVKRSRHLSFQMPSSANAVDLTGPKAKGGIGSPPERVERLDDSAAGMAERLAYLEDLTKRLLEREAARSSDQSSPHPEPDKSVSDREVALGLDDNPGHLVGSLTDIDGIGPAYARGLIGAGIGSLEALKDSDPETIVNALDHKSVTIPVAARWIEAAKKKRSE
jgi:predicted flap endonuclease-1-like 5' DNA nuclease